MIGNHNQIDMIGIIGINKMFVDTYYYWSLNIQKPIIDLKVNTKSGLIINRELTTKLEGTVKTDAAPDLSIYINTTTITKEAIEE